MRPFLAVGKQFPPFLPLVGRNLTTDLHVRSTDRHQNLHYTSAHPNHTKRPIVYNQTLRLSKICSYKNDFEKHFEEMESWFLLGLS